MTKGLSLPAPGDVFHYCEHERLPLSNFFHRLMQALYLRPEEPTHNQYDELRLVEEVRLNVVFYRLPDGTGRAAWLAEWLDWQLVSTQLAHQGKPAPESEIRARIGQHTLPFDLSKYQENQTNE